jgi:hypothetical protein
LPEKCEEGPSAAALEPVLGEREAVLLPGCQVGICVGVKVPLDVVGRYEKSCQAEFKGSYRRLTWVFALDAVTTIIDGSRLLPDAHVIHSILGRNRLRVMALMHGSTSRRGTHQVGLVNLSEAVADTKIEQHICRVNELEVFKPPEKAHTSARSRRVVH